MLNISSSDTDLKVLWHLLVVVKISVMKWQIKDTAKAAKPLAVSLHTKHAVFLDLLT